MRKPTTRGAGQRADEATSGETTEMDDVDGASVGDSHGEDLQIMPEPADATQDTERITLSNSLFKPYRDVDESDMTLRDGARGDHGEGDRSRRQRVDDDCQDVDDDNIAAMARENIGDVDSHEVWTRTRRGDDSLHQIGLMLKEQQAASNRALREQQTVSNRLMKEQQASYVSLLTNAFATFKNFQVQSSEVEIDTVRQRGTDTEQQSRTELRRQQRQEERVWLR